MSVAGFTHAHVYRWVVLGLSLLTIAVAYSVRNSFGVLLLPLQAEFGWSQSAAVAAFTFHWLAFGFTAPLFGGLTDRVTPRRVMPVCAVALALGLVLTTQVRELWHFYVTYGLVLGAAVSSLGMPSHAGIIARWFTTQRGLAYGVLNAGVGVSLLLAGLAQWLTLSFGWRAALLGLAAVLVLVVAPLTALLHRPAPTASSGAVGSGRPAAGASTTGKPAAAFAGARTLRGTVRSRPYWLYFVTYVAYTGHQYVVVVFALPYLVTHGYDPLVAASAFSGTGIANIVGLLCSGPPSERVGREPVVSAGVALLLIAMSALFMAGQGVMAALPVYALAYGLGTGLISPQLSASAADLFAGPRFGTIYGTFNLAAGLGGATVPWLAGRLVESTGLPDLALAVAATLILVPGTLIWVTGPRRFRPSAVPSG